MEDQDVAVTVSLRVVVRSAMIDGGPDLPGRAIVLRLSVLGFAGVFAVLKIAFTG